MQKSRFDKKLTCLYVAILVVAFATYVYFEFFHRLTEAPLAGITAFEEVKYGCEVVTDLIAIGFVYLSLRMMSLGYVTQQLASDPLRYHFWAYLRCAMLALVIFSGLAMHYLFFSSSTLCCSLIGSLAVIFVWPTVNRRHAETNVNSSGL